MEMFQSFVLKHSQLNNTLTFIYVLTHRYLLEAHYVSDMEHILEKSSELCCNLLHNVLFDLVSVLRPILLSDKV